MRRLILVLLLLPLLSACGAMHTAISKHHLRVDTRASAQFHLHLPASQKRVFLDINDADFELAVALQQRLQSKGYEVVETPEDAEVWLQLDLRPNGTPAWQGRRSHDHHGPVIIAPVPVHVGVHAHISGRNAEKLFALAFLVVAAESIGDAMVQDVYFTVHADMRLQQREPAADATQGDHDYPAWREREIHLSSTANQANLRWPQAQAALREELVEKIAGYF